MPKKAITIHYRRLDDVANRFAGTTLEGACRQAFSHQVDGTPISRKLRHRVWERVPGGNDNVFVNILADTGDSIFGDITHFTKGHLQALFDIGLLDEAVAPVEQLPAPERMEYIHSLMYWMIIGNHVLVVQSQSLKTEVLEQYLTWLLCQRSPTIAPPLQVVLATKFDPAAVGGDLNDITGITIGGVVMPEAREPANPPPAPPQARDVVEHGEVTARKLSGFQQARQVLAAFFGGEAQVDDYLRTIPEGAELSLAVHIGYRTRRRQVDRTPLKALETGLRNLGDGEIKVSARGGVKSPNGEIRLHETASVEVYGSLLDPVDVRAKMFSAYQSMVGAGKIVP